MCIDKACKLIAAVYIRQLNSESHNEATRRAEGYKDAAASTSRNIALDLALLPRGVSDRSSQLQ